MLRARFRLTRAWRLWEIGYTPSVMLRFCLLALALLAACAGPPPESRPPNIILILTDDQGYGDAGFHGNDQIRTPNLDQLAAESVELTRFYVEPVCAPTRASLMTGRYYYRSGVVHTSRGGAKMHGEEITVAEMLREAGYKTGHFGKWHMGDAYPMRPIDQGFDESIWHKSGGIGQTPDIPNDYFDPHLWNGGESFQGKGYCTDIFFDAAIDFVNRHKDEPFFIYLPTNAPHTPLTVDDKYSQPYIDAGLDETTAKVYGMVENIDDNLAKLLAALDESGVRDDTVLVFITDNGPQQERYTAGLRGRKGMAYEGGIRAISLWNWPGRFAAGMKSGELSAHIDFAPTALELAGRHIPNQTGSGDRFDGISLAPLLLGSAGALPERHVVLQCHRSLEPKAYQNSALQTSRYKLVSAATTFSDEQWAHSDDPPVELYDLQSDHGEERDLAAELPEVVADLRGRYDDWYEDVRSTRNFEPGIIHLGSEHEDATVLSRYQDSTYVDGRPTTWGVEIETAGRYEFRVRRDTDQSAGVMYVELNGERQSQPFEAGEARAEFDLPAGPGRLDVWTQAAGQDRQITVDNSAEGNVTATALP